MKILIISMIFGIGGLISLWDQDIFWLLKEGQYIVSNFEIPTTELWSSTRSGTAWTNFYWPFSVIFYGVHELGGVTALVVMRCVLLFSILYFVGLSLLTNRFIVLVFLLGLTYFVIYQKLQLRADTFQMLLFASLAFIFKSPWNPLLKWIFVAMGAILIHIGTAPIVILKSTSLLTNHRQIQRKDWPWLILGTFVLAGPFIYFQIPTLILDTLTGGVRSSNPEFDALGFAHFDIRIWGWMGWSYLMIVVLGLTNVISNRKSKEFAVSLSLVLASIVWERLAPYAAISLLPAASSTLDRFLLLLGNKAKVFGLVLMSLLFAAGVYHVKKNWSYFGMSINEYFFPIGNVAQLNRHQWVGNIFHPSNFGAYLLHAAPSYKVFWDTREAPYLDLMEEIREYLAGARPFEDLLKKYDINLVLMPLPPLTLDENGREVDGIFSLFDKAKWALVGMDKVSYLLARRDKLNSKVQIYNLLNPTKDPENVLGDSTQTMAEIENCLTDIPMSPYCLIAKSTLLRKTGQRNELVKNLTLLESVDARELRFHGLLRHEMTRVKAVLNAVNDDSQRP